MFNTFGQRRLGKHNAFLLIQMIPIHKKFVCHSPARPVCSTARLYQTFQVFLIYVAYSPKFSGFLVTAEFLLKEVTLMENIKCTEIWMCLSQLQKQHIWKLNLTYSLNFFI